MSEFLSNFMRAAHAISGAERSVALDADKNILDRLNVDDTLLGNKQFNELLMSSVEAAIQQGQPITTNNMITDPSQAPNTNVHLKDLRMVVTIPVDGQGIVYLEKPIRKGVFEREMIDKLCELAQQVIETGQMNLSDTEIEQLYKELV